MGCGHSKINIYPKRVRNKTSAKKAAAPEKNEVDVAEIAESESELGEKLDDCDRKTIRVKPLGGPLLALKEISSSQQNFFKMLEEKIESGPDYDSASEHEMAAESARLSALLRGWETASSGSRSLPPTPRRKPRPVEKVARSAVEQRVDLQRPNDRPYTSYIPQSVVHQSYGVTASYRQTSYGTVYHSPPPTHHPPPIYPSQYHVPMYNQHGSPIKTYAKNSPKHIPYEPADAYSSPGHKSYLAQNFSNGELIQQQIYSQQLQYQQAKEYQQYKQTKEQQLLQQHAYLARNYQSGVHVPTVVMQTRHDDGSLHRKQYELT